MVLRPQVDLACAGIPLSGQNNVSIVVIQAVSLLIFTLALNPSLREIKMACLLAIAVELFISSYCSVQECCNQFSGVRVSIISSLVIAKIFSAPKFSIGCL